MVGAVGQSEGFQVRQVWVQILVLPLANQETLGYKNG